MIPRESVRRFSICRSSLSVFAWPGMALLCQLLTPHNATATQTWKK
jgi:hypothetical protein